jgi:Flp pilus assembly protein TadD
MAAKSIRFLSLGLSFLALTACQNMGGHGDGRVAEPEANLAVDPNLELTIRKAAAGAEATYNYAEAAQHYTTLLEKHPDDQDIILAVARNLRYSGSPQQAAAVVTKSISKVGPKEPLLVEAGKDYIAADQVNLAIPVLQQAHTADPTNWQILSALGVAQDIQGNYKDAQATYQDGLKASPNNPVLLNNYALSLAQSGDLDKAIATLQTATDQTSASAQTRQNLALMLALKGDKEGAARLIRSDLPSEMAQNNIAYYDGLTAPQSTAP